MVTQHLLPGFGGGIAATAIISFVLLLYVIFDVIVSDEMLLVEKLIWVVLAVTTGLIGILLYLYLVKYRAEFISDHAELESVQTSFTETEADRLEKLSLLKEKGDLTEEEFERKKAEILGEEE